MFCSVSCIGIVPETKEVVIHKYKTPMVSPFFFRQSVFLTRCVQQNGTFIFVNMEELTSFIHELTLNRMKQFDIKGLFYLWGLDL